VLRDQQVDRKQHIYVKHQRRIIPVKKAMLCSLLISIVMIGYYLICERIGDIYHTFKLIVILTVVMFGYFYFVLDKVIEEKQWHASFFKIMHSLFIIWNVYFIAIYLRKLRYLDELNGLTSSQFIQHAILYFFIIMYLYTLIRIWVRRISLTHFYFIFSMLFYMTLN